MSAHGGPCLHAGLPSARYPRVADCRAQAEQCMGKRWPVPHGEQACISPPLPPVRSVSGLLVGTQTCSWSHFTKPTSSWLQPALWEKQDGVQKLNECILASFARGPASCKRGVYRKEGLRRHATMESFYSDPEITPRHCARTCSWNPAVRAASRYRGSSLLTSSQGMQT